MKLLHLKLVLASLAFLHLLLPFRAMAESEKPNVVIILADDLGWGSVGYHADWVETPNIDRLAQSGIELDRFYVAPMCSPTRAGLLTGRYPIRFGLARAVIPPYRKFGLPVEEQTIADGLANVGYKHRGIFGKWHLGHHDKKWHPLSRGFTQFEGHYNGAIDYFDLSREGERDWHLGMKPASVESRAGYATDLITDATCKFIKEAAADDAPYFCYVPFNAPHSPFQAPEKDIARFSKKDDPGNAAILKAMIWRMDIGIGKILETIEATGESDNTQVWFFSDNGGIKQIDQTNHPLSGHKLTTFEGGIRVPACVRWPARWRGQRKISQTMGYIDVLPTVLSSAGSDPNAGLVGDRRLDGVDLGDLLIGEKSVEPREREWYSYHGQGGAKKETIAIATSKWKLIVTGPDIRKGKSSDQHEVHLYRMPDDLREKKNLASDSEFQSVVETLFQKLVVHRKLQPANGVRAYREGKDEFTPWKNWDINSATGQ